MLSDAHSLESKNKHIVTVLYCLSWLSQSLEDKEIAQVLEYVFSMLKFLGSIPSTCWKGGKH